MKFTGFYEVRVPHGEDVEQEQMLATVAYIETPELLARLSDRLEGVPPGSHIRIDLIAWDGVEP
jgi:hypothetical protein